MRLFGPVLLLTAAGLVGVPFAVFALRPAASTVPDCAIKGMVSADSGARIYHMPGQWDYNSFVVKPERGERWFCSEAEARKAGWKKSLF